MSPGGTCPRNFPVGKPSTGTLQSGLETAPPGWELIANELTLLNRLKSDKGSLPKVAIIDSQSVKNTATATDQIGIDGGKLIKGRKRTLLVDTMGLILGIGINSANQHDSKTGLRLWQEVRLFNPVVDEVEIIYADSTFGGYFKQQIEAVPSMKVFITRSPINDQATDSKMVIHKWRWIVERTLAWLNHNRRLAKDYERTILSAKTFIWIAHIRRTLKQVYC
jgi:putative transposase